ncbi:MAG: response regulator [Bacteroidota bacterium]
MREKILICDDEEDILQVVSIILEKEGYEVTAINRVDNPIKLIKRHNPSLILMDLWIPEIGGEEALKIIKENPETAHIPIVLFSANNEIDGIAKRAEADGYIHKPFTIQHLKSYIGGFLTAD